jgi:hypothetical protein
MRTTIAWCVLAVLAQSTMTSAQSWPGSAAKEPAHVLKVTTSSFTPSSSADLIREIAADGDPGSWLAADEIPAAAWDKSDPTIDVAFEIDADTTGLATACKLRWYEKTQAPAWAGELCTPLAERARFIPALRSDGTRVADHMTVYVTLASKQKPSLELFSRKPDFGTLLLAALMKANTKRRAGIWPPDPRWLQSNFRQPIFKLPVEDPGGPAPTGSATGLLVADPKSQLPACQVKRSSGDAKRDNRACTFVRSKLIPHWDEQVPLGIRQWPLLVDPTPKGFRVIQPNVSAYRRLIIEPAESIRLRKLWRFEVNDAGRVSLLLKLDDGKTRRCSIRQSSGNDQADAAACRVATTQAVVSPERDVFGQPRPLRGEVSLGFSPRPAPSPKASSGPITTP